MPQIILECSNNVLETDLIPFLGQVNQILTNNLPTDLSSCKSRIIRHDEYVIGDNNPENAFAHLSIHVLPGRTQELLNQIATQIMENFKQQFERSLNQLNMQLTIAMNQLPEIYLKAVSPK